MAELKQAAVMNAALWCDAVCAAHGRRTLFAAGLWLAPDGAPPLYPDAATLPRADPVRARARIARMAEGRTLGMAVKDGFGDLDLAPLGFRPFIEGAWLVAGMGGGGLTPAAGGERLAPVAGDGGLAGWEADWRGGEDLPTGLRMFPPALLSRSEIRFLSDGAGSGGVLCLGAGVVGASNLYAAPGRDPAAVWQDIATAAGGLWPGKPVVTWAHGAELEAARAAGFARLGRMRVWLRPGVAGR